MRVAGFKRLLWNTGCIFPNKGVSFKDTVTGFITLLMVKGPMYLGPNFLLGIHNFRYFVDRYTLSPTLKGGGSTRFLFVCCLYSIEALFNASLICGQILPILSIHSVSIFSSLFCISNSGIAGSSFPDTNRCYNV